jgi:uncharacterized protein (TIGR03435 family)
MYSLTVASETKLALSDKRDKPTGFRIMGGGRLESDGTSMGILAGTLEESLATPVRDDTNLKGYYVVKIHWIDDLARQADAADPDAVSIFQALPEQAGLKLASQKRPVDVLVVEGANKIPTAN